VQITSVIAAKIFNKKFFITDDKSKSFYSNMGAVHLSLLQFCLLSQQLPRYLKDFSNKLGSYL
jgi:hypothetical protein